jgi:hypothetical protein
VGEFSGIGAVGSAEAGVPAAAELATGLVTGLRFAGTAAAAERGRELGVDVREVLGVEPEGGRTAAEDEDIEKS